ncbi:anoctamin-4-like isoform X2 [Rhopilema esculentum]|uniref:anoctamin-4-like isoform X2 n=1 Tax=Rhopilema esculentum TaxID=499914 RepID=UPI0031E32F21
MAEQLGLINGMELQHTDDATKTLFFDDGIRRIDYVLAYDDEEDEEELQKNSEMRKVFLENLVHQGLQVEEALSTKDSPRDDYGSTSPTPSGEKEKLTHFIKIHAPFDELLDIAEDMKMKMPIQENDVVITSWVQKNLPWLDRAIKKNDPFVVRDSYVKEEPNFFVATFDKFRLKDFIGSSNQDEFFSPAERSRLVYYICEKTRYGDGRLQIGIDHMVHEGIFLAQYTLHDGRVHEEEGQQPENDRQRLHHDWASFKRIFKYQPIPAIKEYFGEKVALYFAWLGFYTTMLLPASIVGFICFLYGIGSSFNYVPVKEICKPSNESLFYMCPLCDKLCSYYLLSTTTCLYAKVTHWFDNQATLFFALFMSFWAVFFLEFWKRRQVSLAYEWHTMDFEEEEERPRPQYVARVTTLKEDPVTGNMEPVMPPSQKVPRLVGAGGIVVFFIILVIAGVTSVIVYRAAIYAILLSTSSTEIRTRAKIVVAGTAACINLLVINILKFVYQRVAVMLTDWENPRTQTDYEDSFTVKMFWFQFVNTYASVFYVAFFKNEYFIGSPGKYKRFGGATAFRFEGCSAQGCFLELCVQLIIIMVGQQFIGNVTEIGIPWLMKMLKRREASKYTASRPQWEMDYDLQSQDELSLFWQYLEIVLQYGFVTMFVAAFPLAPFFAWLNNIVEIRLDAVNFIKNFRRPVAQRAEDIGAWFYVLSTLTEMSVLVNAFVLAFTSELIPKLVYTYKYNIEGTLHGYVDFSMSYFNVADFTNSSRPDNPTANVNYTMPFCRYPGFHDGSSPYSYSKVYWITLAARLAFVFVFQWFITVVSRVIAYIIPDMPKSLDLKIKREHFLAKEKEISHREATGKRKPRTKDKQKDDSKWSEDLSKTETQML